MSTRFLLSSELARPTMQWWPQRKFDVIDGYHMECFIWYKRQVRSDVESHDKFIANVLANAI